MAKLSSTRKPAAVKAATPSATAADLSVFQAKPFADALSELQQFMSQSNRTFLFGAGSSKCAGLPLMPELTKLVLEKLTSGAVTRHILDSLIQGFQGAANANIEDYMSELVDLACIADRRRQRGAASPDVCVGEQNYSASQLFDALAEIKDAIADVISASASSIAIHRSFLRSIHRTLHSGRSGTLPTVDYFTLNYDTLIEDALSLERISVSDGFNGGATGWWDSQTYGLTQAQARVFKIHGSIDWCLCGGDVLPRRLRHKLTVDGKTDRVLIWPAATKYRETQRDPYAQIIEFMRKSLRPSQGSEALLVICGYAFGDSHINLEVERALLESNDRLTVIVFTSDNEPTGVIKEWVDHTMIGHKVRVYANRGFFHGEDVRRSDADLPWWRFEVLTTLISGES